MKPKKYLLETRTTGSQAQVSYRDGFREAPETRAAVCMGLKETGMRTGSMGSLQSASELGLGTGMCVGTAEQSEKH